MKALMFDIGGKLAHFKNPENNYSIEVTYEQITKPHLLGILGAIVGLNGRQRHKDLGYIEYYEKLKGAMVSIVPHKAKWQKHIDNTTNTTGFANKDSYKKDGKPCTFGTTQTLTRQYLNNPKWTIYIIQANVSDDIWNTLTQNLLNGESEYPIYLGQTGCYANITNVKTIDVHDVKIEDIECCDSLFEYSKADIEIENGSLLSKLMLPVNLNEKGLYIKKWICFTDNFVEFKSLDNIKGFNEKILYFM